MVHTKEKLDKRVFETGRAGINGEHAPVDCEATGRNHADHADIVEDDLNLVTRLQAHCIQIGSAHGRFHVSEAVGPGNEVVRNIRDRGNVEFGGQYRTIAIDEASDSLGEEVAGPELGAAIRAVDVAVLDDMVLHEAKREFRKHVDDLDAVVEPGILNTIVIIVFGCLGAVAARRGIAVDKHLSFVRRKCILLGHETDRHRIE